MSLNREAVFGNEDRLVYFPPPLCGERVECRFFQERQISFCQEGLCQLIWKPSANSLTQ